MGLDMYLERRPAKCRKSSWNDVMNAIPYELYSQISSSWRELGYWRKANHIHNWFVKNVQGGKDDCGTYPVTAKDLMLLRAACVKVLMVALKGTFVPIVYQQKKRGYDYRIIRLPNAECKHTKVANWLKHDDNMNFTIDEVPTGNDYKKSLKPKDRPAKGARLPSGWVLDAKTAKEIAMYLPTQSGFFFGSVEYTPAYLEDCIHTIEVCDKVLKIEKEDTERSQRIYDEVCSQALKNGKKKPRKASYFKPTFIFEYTSSW